MGRDKDIDCIALMRATVSIHAPVWGATIKIYLITGKFLMFQSTRPCGARHLPVRLNALQQGVSIHAPVWGATIESIFNVNTTTVSIHAPVWGATIYVPVRRLKLKSFNPRARVGRDLTRLFVKSRRIAFQSTRPCGARQAKISQAHYNTRFNPRARVGRDILIMMLTGCRISVSIHAPVWGATEEISV